MEQKELAKKSKFTVLKDGMKGLGLDPDDVDDKEEAVKAIYDKLLADGEETVGLCPTCEAELPNVDVCPFCGESLVEDEKAAEAPEEKKTKKGKKKKEEDPNRVAGADILQALVKEMDIPEEHVHNKKSRISLWTESGLIAKCFVQKWAVRFHVPFLAEKYTEEAAAILVDFETPIKNMYSRFTLNSLDEINSASTVLVETGKLKAASAGEKNAAKEAEKEKKKAERLAKKEAEKDSKKEERETKKEAKKAEKTAAREAKKAKREADKKEKADAAAKKESKKKEE